MPGHQYLDIFPEEEHYSPEGVLKADKPAAFVRMVNPDC